MPTRSVEKLELAVIGTHDKVGEHVGLVAVNPCFEDDEVTRRGTSVEVTIGKIEAPYVGLRQWIIREDGEPDDVSTAVEGIIEPHRGYAYYDNEGVRQDWHGDGYSWSLGGKNTWGHFGWAYPYEQDKRPLEQAVWQVGDQAVLEALKQAVADNSDTEAHAMQLFGSTYIRMNSLIAISYRNRLKDGGIKPIPLVDLLLIDPTMRDYMSAELEKANKYKDFTVQHIHSDQTLIDEIDAGVSKSSIPDLAERFEAERNLLASRQTEAQEVCAAMFESVYVPSGFRIGAGRTWPYMDVGDYDREMMDLNNGNFGNVRGELEREQKELDYKIREFTYPSVTVLRALAGDKKAILYS